MATYETKVSRGNAQASFDLWQYRACLMCQAVLPALVRLRDAGRIELNVESSYDHMKLDFIIGMLDEANYPEIGFESRQAIKAYLSSLPGFNECLGSAQSEVAVLHHRYLVMAASHA